MELQPPEFSALIVAAKEVLTCGCGPNVMLTDGNRPVMDAAAAFLMDLWKNATLADDEPPQE